MKAEYTIIDIDEIGESLDLGWKREGAGKKH